MSKRAPFTPCGRSPSRIAAMCLSLLLLFTSATKAHEETVALGPGIRLQFLPPPMAGVISLGVYDSRNKLIRTLHQQASTRQFRVGLDGLVTAWDGKNDAGIEMPAGKYTARGYVVGDVAVSGEAFHFNDWIGSESSPRIRRIVSFGPARSDGLVLMVQLADGSLGATSCDLNGKLTEITSAETSREGFLPPHEPGKIHVVAERAGVLLGIDRGGIVTGDGKTWRKIDLPSLHAPLHACWGKGDNFWVIDRADGAIEVKEYSQAGEFQRRLAIDPADPAPQQVGALPSADAIFLIEGNEHFQRLRALKLVEGQPADGTNDHGSLTSLWKVACAKTITFSDDLGLTWPKLVRERKDSAQPEQRTVVRLVPNELNPKADRSLTVELHRDAEGSFLRTLDGLFLLRLSETRNLLWAAFARAPGSKTVAVFQSDGAVVEEYKVSRLANMMAFDCGEFEFAPVPAASL